MKKTIFCWLLSLVLILICASLIFGLSSERASDSKETSKAITEIILEFFFHDFEDLSKDKRLALISSFDGVVRSLAHFFEYLLLSFALSFHLFFYNSKKRQKVIIALIFCICFSIFDEIHQMFVPGRSFQFSDILVDSAGVIIGISIFFFMLFLSGKIKEHKLNKK